MAKRKNRRLMSGQHKPHKKGVKSGARNRWHLSCWSCKQTFREFDQYQQDEQVPLTSSHWTHDKESTTHTDGNSGLDLEMTQSSGGDNFLAFDPYISTIKYLLYTCVHGHRMHCKRMGMRCWSYRNLSTRYSRTRMSVTVYLKKYIFMKK
jgi:hypothetical protein